MDSSRKYLAFLVLNATWRGEFAEKLKLRFFSRSYLLYIGIYCNALLTYKLWFLKSRDRTSGGPRIRKKSMFIRFEQAKLLGCFSVFRPIGGFLTKNHVVTSAGNLSFFQFLRL